MSTDRPGRGVTGAPGSGSEPGDADAARLREELASTQAELARVKRRTNRRGRARRVGVGILVALFALLVPLTVVTTWAHRTVLNTSAFVGTLKPIASNPAVISAASADITNEIYQELNPEQVVAQALPPKAQFLAGPITNGTKSYVQQGVEKVLSSNQFQTIWLAAVTFAHTQVVDLLRGDSKVVQQTSNGVVVLNLVPLLNAALTNVQDFASNVVGKPVQLPQISGNELPASACAKIGAALNRPVPATCGQIALFKAKNLASARRLVKAFDRLTIALLVVTPIIFILALWLSRRRRRTLLQLTLGAMVLLVIVRRVLYWEEGRLVSTGPPANHDARAAIIHGLLNGLFTASAWVLVAGLIIVLAALVTGPYRWAAAIREAARRSWDMVYSAVTGQLDKDPAALGWVRRHIGALRIGGAVVAVLLLLLINMNVWWVLVVAALLALYEFGLYRLRPPHTVTLPPGQGTSSSLTVPPQPRDV